MKRSTFAFSAAAAVLLLSRIAGAQTSAPGNQNDIVLHNGGDIVYIYNDPSIGPAVGTSGIADYLTNDYMWKVWPAKTMSHCSGTMEITGLELQSFGEDYATPDVNGNNTTLPDLDITTGIVGGATAAVDCIEPVQVGGTYLSFGAGAPLYNVAAPPPPCAPVGFIYGYFWTVDLTNVLTQPGVFVTADGATDTVMTQFMPGAGHGHTAGGSCGTGDGVLVDFHSSSLGGGVGEQQRDSLNDGLSALGGYGIAGAISGADPNDEVGAAWLEFREPTVAMMVTPATATEEEGLAGVEFDWNAVGGGGGTVRPRTYALQNIGLTTRIPMNIFAPLGACAPAGNPKLHLNPADPIFFGTLGIPCSNASKVVLTDNGLPATLTAFDDGTSEWVVPIGIGAKPAGTGSITVHYQAVYKYPGPFAATTWSHMGATTLSW